jgi:hypothetical protein
MIPGKIIRFLEERANIALAGTRNADLAPRGHRVSGWHVAPGGGTLAVYISETTATELLDSLLENGRIAVTFEEVGTHETYQLKGRYSSHRPVQPPEIDTATRARERLKKSLRNLHHNDALAEAVGRSIGPPSLVIEIEVNEVFLQTPGPGAGQRLAPPPDVPVSAT